MDSLVFPLLVNVLINTFSKSTYTARPTGRHLGQTKLTTLRVLFLTSRVLNTELNPEGAIIDQPGLNPSIYKSHICSRIHHVICSSCYRDVLISEPNREFFKLLSIIGKFEEVRAFKVRRSQSLQKEKSSLSIYKLVCYLWLTEEKT